MILKITAMLTAPFHHVNHITLVRTNLVLIAFPLGVLLSIGAGLNTILLIEEALLDWLSERWVDSLIGRLRSFWSCEEEAL